MNLKFLLLFIISLFAYNTANSQSIKFPELSEKLERYFGPDMIKDISEQMPQTEYNIWGWGVGDFSGDGFYDFAVSVDIRTKKGRIIDVFSFVDIEGYMVKVGQREYKYVDLPLEIGVVVRNNTFFVTQKFEQFNWIIRGYTFDNGSLVMLDEFRTKRVGKLTRETYRNFVNLRNTEKYINTNNAQERFSADYLSIPVYPRGKKIYKGIKSRTFSSYIDYVPKGAYWWKGEEDASFNIRAAYDDQFLYMQVDVKDDHVVYPFCDTCKGDFVDLWLDINPFKIDDDRFLIGNVRDMNFRTTATTGIYKFSVYPGDFYENKAYVEISSTDDMQAFQKIAAHRIKVVSALNKDGYTLKFKIPFQVLGLEENPADVKEYIQFGSTMTVHDIDNEFRPEEETLVSTSIFNEMNPSTYGNIVLVPEEKWYGDAENIFQSDIMSQLKEFGF